MRIEDPQSGRKVPFPHFENKYKCCCEAVHVKQGTLLIGIVSAVLAFFGLVSLILSKETPLVTVLQIVYLALEVLCIVLLFVAIKKGKKRLLIPFCIYQALSALMCIVFAFLCIWVIFDANSSIAETIKANLLSTEELEIERSHPDMHPALMIRMAAVFLCTAFVLSLIITIWWLSVIVKCYQYFADIEKHRQPFDAAVAYNVVEAPKFY